MEHINSSSLIHANDHGNSMEIWISPREEASYLNVLTIFAVLAVPAHLLIIGLALFKTPAEMVNYRLTVTNTSIWSLLMGAHVGLLFRPVVYFPHLPIAKVTGVVARLGVYYGGALQLLIAFLLTVNFITAACICFLVICVFLIDTSMVVDRLTRIDRHIGIGICVGMHVFITVMATVFLLCVYDPMSLELKKELDKAGIMIQGITDDDSVVLVGYSPLRSASSSILDINNHSHIHRNGGYLAMLIHALLVLIVIVVVILFSVLIRYLWESIYRGCDKATNRRRRAIVCMLTSRVMIPLGLGFAPVLAVTAQLHFRSEVFGMGPLANCFLVGCAATHGLFNSLATALVFRPYRDELKELVQRVVPQWIASRIGLTWGRTTTVGVAPKSNNDWRQTQIHQQQKQQAHRSGMMGKGGGGGGQTAMVQPI